MQIRRQALDLLARAPRREGMWESDDAVMVAGEALSRAEESSDASEMSVSPPPQECPSFEAGLWEEIPNEHHTDRFMLPLHQHINEQQTAFVDGVGFTQSMSLSDLGNFNFTQDHIEQSMCKIKGGNAFV